ncbi:MAG: hypothetical protein BWY59_00020 [Verrucomicrobia bacterium ADurb.Bin345]|nr:MAG: hypothetical protein BWY59_00020 [Verrucomicrobia bacterium ADurb.Bin345]
MDAGTLGGVDGLFAVDLFGSLEPGADRGGAFNRLGVQLAFLAHLDGGGGGPLGLHLQGFDFLFLLRDHGLRDGGFGLGLGPTVGHGLRRNLGMALGRLPHLKNAVLFGYRVGANGFGGIHFGVTHWSFLLVYVFVFGGNRRAR